MRSIVLSFSLAFICLTSLSQQTVEANIFHDGIQRSFIVYVPASYNEAEAAPLLFNFHGYTDNAANQMAYGDFRPIADTSGFIIVHPQGTADFLGLNHWNSGGWTLFSTVDDVGFTDKLIDVLSTQLNIDQERIYSTGMSNGGFMSYLLACQLSNRIAAIASVTGAMSPQTYNQCNPERPVPVLEIHGTADDVVPYVGGGINRSIRDAMKYWIQYNDCPIDPTIEAYEDIDMSDGSSATKVNFSGGINGTEVEHIRIAGGGHDWPGSSGNMDINASVEIWKFLSRFDVNGLRMNLPSQKKLSPEAIVNIFPNPTTDLVNIRGAVNEPFVLMDIAGKVLQQGVIQQDTEQISTTDYPSGMYILQVGTERYKVLKES